MSRRGLWCRQVCDGCVSLFNPLGGWKCFDNSSQNFEHGPFFLSCRCYTVFQRSTDRFTTLRSPIWPSVSRHLFNDASANSTGKSSPWEVQISPDIQGIHRFMEPEFSLHWSQGTATGPFPVPDESSPHPRIFFHVGVQFFIPSTPRFSSRLFNFKFSYQNPVCFCPIRATYPSHPILFIWAP